MIVAPDGVDLVRYQNLPGPEAARSALLNRISSPLISSLNQEAFTVGYSGHLYAGRGTQMLIELAACLPQFNFLIVGGEPAQVEAYRRESESRALHNLFLTGFVPNAELPLYQAACDVLLMPYEQKVEASSGGDISRYLSPMKLFEYLASERAIISSNLPVLCEVLNPHNSLLLPTTETTTWKEAILSLHRNPVLRAALARQARQDANAYTWQGRAQRILQGLETRTGS